MDVKAALTNRDRMRILESCEYGEDAALAVYKDELTLANGHLTADQRSMINRQYDRLKADHDRIREMRDTLKT